MGKRGLEYYFTSADEDACMLDKTELRDLIETTTSEWQALLVIARHLQTGRLVEHDVPDNGACWLWA
eukprot:5874324-Pleurochrysis_carterae.AAC.1